MDASLRHQPEAASTERVYDANGNVTRRIHCNTGRGPHAIDRCPAVRGALQRRGDQSGRLLRAANRLTLCWTASGGETTPTCERHLLETRA